METTIVQKRFILLGAISGILAGLIYPLIYYFDFHLKTDLLLDLLFGFAIGFASYGIFRFIKINIDSVCLQVGVILALLAAFSYILKSSIMVSMKAPLEGILVQGDQSFVYALTNRLYIGVEFVWKLLIGGAILSFSIAFFEQPKPGKIIAIFGILVSLIILGFAIYSFPQLPEEINLMGMGAALAIWHLFVSILMLVSLKWIKVKGESRLA